MAVEKYLFPREWGTDQPLTVEGRTQAANKSPAEILDIIRRWVKQNDQMWEDSRNGKNTWTKDLYDEMDQRLNGYLQDTLATMGITEESLMRDYQKAMEEREKEKEQAFEDTIEKTKQEQIDAEKEIESLTGVAKQGNVADFETLSKAVRRGFAAERQCQLLPVCDPKRDTKATELFDQWAEAFSNKCKSQKFQNNTRFVLGLERQRQLFGLGGEHDDKEELSDEQKADLARRLEVSRRLMNDCLFQDPNWPSQLSGTITIKGGTELGEAEEKFLKIEGTDGSVGLHNTTHRLQGNLSFEWIYDVTGFMLAEHNGNKIYELLGRVTRSANGSCTAINANTNPCGATKATTTGSFAGNETDQKAGISVKFSGIGNREFSMQLPFKSGAQSKLSVTRNVEGCDKTDLPKSEVDGQIHFGPRQLGVTATGVVDENGKIDTKIAIEGEDIIRANIDCNTHLDNPDFPVSATVEIKLQ